MSHAGWLLLSLGLTALWWLWGKPRLDRQLAEAEAEQKRKAEMGAAQAYRVERDRSGPTDEEVAAKRDVLLAHAWPAVLLQRRWPPAPRHAALNSYFGGLPRLAPDQVWPIGAEGSPQTFLCQIDLADLPDTLDIGARDGVLLFFCDTQFEGVGDPPSAVLFQPGRGGDHPERPAPDNLMRAGGYAQASRYQWLDDAEEGARGDLRQAITFVPFTSYADTEGDGVALWNTGSAHQKAYQALQMDAFRAALPPPVPASPRVVPSQDPAWPATWMEVEHMGRALAHRLASLWKDQRDALVHAVEAEIVPWIERAKLRPWDAPPAAERDAFRDWWRLARKRLTEPLPNGGYRLFDRYLDEIEQLVAERTLGLAALDDRPLPDALADRPWTWSEASPGDALPVVHSSFPKHQMLGYGLSVQNAVGEHWDDLLLLQIACIDDLAWARDCGFGVLQFWITPQALAERRFSDVVATFETD